MENQTKGLGLMLGEEGHLPWSHSKAETAKTCMWKFAKIYIDGERENSPSLLLGSFAHETLEALLRDSEAPTEEKALDYLTTIKDNYNGVGDKEEAFNVVVGLIPYIVEFTERWKDFINNKNIKHWKIESDFGLTEEMKRAQYEPGIYRTYLRGRVDLWAYDPVEKILYVIDHKTNKNIDSPKKVKENMQLNLYVSFITKTYNLKWGKAYFGLNFLRKNKIVWSSTTPKENSYFTQVYYNTLHTLEKRLLGCELDGYYPPEESYKCGMCSFKSVCPKNKVENLVSSSISSIEC